MDPEELLKTVESTKRLIQDEYYYKYIFKKTERIVSVVFYVLYNVQEDRKSDIYLEDIRHAARSVHDAILHSLEIRQLGAEDVIRSTAHSLITLESKLHIGFVTGLFQKSVYDTFVAEIDSVIRGLNRYLNDDPVIVALGDALPQAPAKQPRRQSATTNPAVATVGGNTNQTTASATSSSGGMHRRDRIKTVLEARPEATIKDISEVVTDCSEKTIQRELNAMIAEGVVIRHGERRWSKYSIAE